MIFRQLFDSDTSTYTYLLADEASRRAIIIDPVLERADRDIALLDELALSLAYVVETHVHADHVTAAAVLTTRLGGEIVAGRAAGAQHAHRAVSHGDRITVGEVDLEVRETPGHTVCSMALVGAGMAFTGDTLLIRGCGRTDFQGGDAATLFRSVQGQLFTLPDDTAVYPGHDYEGRTMSTIGEERQHNPRLGGGKTEVEFVEIMKGLDLPSPGRLELAVPANRRSGFEMTPDDWAPIARTASGIPEVSAEWVAQHGNTVRLIDCRRTDEYTGPLHHIAKTELVPLDGLPQAAETWPREVATVVICRSGGRSGRACLALQKMGFSKVASMAGGMLRWNGLSLPVEAADGPLG